MGFFPFESFSLLLNNELFQNSSDVNLISASSTTDTCKLPDVNPVRTLFCSNLQVVRNIRGEKFEDNTESDEAE